MEPDSLMVGAYQFAAGPDVAANLRALEEGIAQASAAGVRLLLTQECALTGYPPVETASAAGIDHAAAERALAQLQALAAARELFVAVGTVERHRGGFRNALRVLTPRGEAGTYAKRALGGWDAESFLPGEPGGVFTIDGVTVGLRICYEVRFPEYFRELFAAGVEVACVALCDTAAAPNPARHALLEAHLRTRAVENDLTLVAANSASRHPLAPTAIFGPDGDVLAAAPPGVPALVTHAWRRVERNFGRRDRVEHARRLLRRG